QLAAARRAPRPVQPPPALGLFLGEEHGELRHLLACRQCRPYLLSELAIGARRLIEHLHGPTAEGGQHLAQGGGVEKNTGSLHALDVRTRRGHAPPPAAAQPVWRRDCPAT